MATSCEGNNWFWVYFTSVNNIAKCDICYTSFQITEVPKENIMIHIKTEHSVDYQLIVLSKGSQKDLESQLYIIQNNDITCKFCNSTFYATNNSYSLINHLEKTHKIRKDKTAKNCELLRKYYFDESDTDMRRRCTSCNETILNKPLLLLSHLRKIHEVNVPLEYKSVWSWVWEYYTRSKRLAKCSVCSENFALKFSKANILYHIKTEHVNMFDVSENSQENKNWPYSITENNKIKCDNCDKSYDLLFCASAYMRTHLAEKHNLNEDIARKLCDRVLEYFHISNLQTSKCNICVNMFQTSNSFNLMIHLKEVHQVRVSPEIIPKRFLISKKWVWEYFIRSENQKAKCSVCSKNFPLKYTTTIISHIKMKHGNTLDVSENSKGNKNWPYSVIENNQLKCDICDKIYNVVFYASSYMKTHLVEEHNLNEDIARKLYNWVLENFQISNLQTSKCNMCENVFQKSNSFNLLIHLKEAHQIQVSPEIIPARLSSELNSLFNSNRYAQDIDTTSKSQQPIGSFDQSSDCDNFYYQIDGSSEIRTTRLPSIRENFNSFKAAEVIATSNMLQQPTLNFDQSSDCDNFSDQIDESSEIRTTRLLSSSSRLLNSDNNAEDFFAALNSYQQPTCSRY